jgi:hypothetical protein
MPESNSGLRMAKVWKTKANISMPVPATSHAMMAPATPVAVDHAQHRTGNAEDGVRQIQQGTASRMKIALVMVPIATRPTRCTSVQR